MKKLLNVVKNFLASNVPYSSIKVWQLLLILLVTVFHPVGMALPFVMGAIAYDATAGTAAGGVTSLTFAHTNTGSNLILWVGGLTRNPTSTVSGITYNGSSLTAVNNATGPADGGRIYLQYKLAPSTGSNNVVISTAGSTDIHGASASYTGALQSGVPDASNTNTGTTTPITTSVTTVGNNASMVSVCGSNAEAPAAGTNTTGRTSVNRIAIGDRLGPLTPAGSYSMGWTTSVNSNLEVAQASFLPSEVSSPSSSVSLSPSPTPSSSISPSPSRSISLSPSLSPSLSVSSSVSPTPSSSVSLSPSLSISLSPSATPSSSISLSPSLSISPSPSLSISLSPSVSASLSISLSPSISVSLSPSISPSTSESPSPSTSVSLSVSSTPSSSPSKSASGSQSRSISPSHSPSPSCSPSLSPSISESISPSAPVSLYTREAKNSLPSTKDDLATIYTTLEEQKVYSNNEVYVDLSGGASKYLLHQFKKLNGNRSDWIKVRVDLKSSLGPEDSPIYLQVWNGLTNSFLTVDSDTVKEADEDLSLYADITEDTFRDGSWYDFNNEFCCRVYQLNNNITNILSVDLVQISFLQNFEPLYVTDEDCPPINYDNLYPHKNPQDDTEEVKF